MQFCSGIKLKIKDQTPDEKSRGESSDAAIGNHVDAFYLPWPLSWARCSLISLRTKTHLYGRDLAISASVTHALPSQSLWRISDLLPGETHHRHQLSSIRCCLLGRYICFVQISLGTKAIQEVTEIFRLVIYVCVYQLSFVVWFAHC